MKGKQNSSSSIRHWGCRVDDQLTYAGYRALLLQNELLQLLILLDKGAEIVQFLYKPLDVDFLWRGSNPLRSPKHFIPTDGMHASLFFNRWSGGWFEVLPNGGPACRYKGAELGFFAETINVPWDYTLVEDSPEKVTVGLSIRTSSTPFLLQKYLTLKAGTPALFIQECVTNQGKESMEFMWGHHPVVGAPFLDESCRLCAPACEVEVFHDEDGPDYRMGLHQTGEWPIIKDRNGNPLDLRQIPSPSSRTMDNCYLKNFEEGWMAIVNTNKKIGLGFSWDAQVFRYVWLWQALGGGIGYPWYGRTYNIGMEPWTSYPCCGLESAVERGTTMRLEAGQSIETWLTAVAFTGSADVTQISKYGIVQR